MKSLEERIDRLLPGHVTMHAEKRAALVRAIMALLTEEYPPLMGGEKEVPAQQNGAQILLDLARKFDETPAEDSRARLAIGDEMEPLLGEDRAEFLEHYDRLMAEGCPGPATTALKQIGEERPAPPPEAIPAPPPLSEEQRIEQAATAYRRWRTLALQSQVAEDDLKNASATWQADRDSFEQGTPAWARLQEATERIDAEIAEERRRPLLHPHQLPGALRVS